MYVFQPLLLYRRKHTSNLYVEVFLSFFLQFVGTITKIMKLENTIVHVIDISVLVPPAILTYEWYDGSIFTTRVTLRWNCPNYPFTFMVLNFGNDSKRS